MKSQLLSIDGKKVKEIELPKLFSTKIREDIMKKVFEAEKQVQPYSPNPKAGRQHSASGISRKLRHVWKSGYGHGRSRVPRKIMWRRGTQFYWIGAEISSTRGGRRAHPPKIAHMLEKKKINKKELEIAMKSAIAGTAINDKVKGKYLRLADMEVKELPIVVESKLLGLKTKELIKSLENILGKLFVVALPEKRIRAGKGKLRNRKYKKSAGALLVIGNKEDIKTKVIETQHVGNLMVSDLYPTGRLVVYTEEAINELGEAK